LSITDKETFNEENIFQNKVFLRSLPDFLPNSFHISSKYEVSDYLDKNHPGWHDKYNTLNKSTPKGYGKFGPRTTKAWATYKDEYLKGTNTTTGNPDLEVDDKDASFDQPF